MLIVDLFHLTVSLWSLFVPLALVVAIYVWLKRRNASQ
jgi:hypothetical protein